jgi:hypothetical protein
MVMVPENSITLIIISFGQALSTFAKEATMKGAGSMPVMQHST